ncbi:MAG: tripartite tricarboxylate transporter TctB family protein [Candidatus Rokubacteria bacterium]|nr:tripartite tricarboxylate transporter TctB family protein [Candidatus Rokubacteria bacterium]MBI3825007.1 tripartite tricarboxylate transporter TctB family protein [Candidatus Rokubacteria bacterium]
MRAADLATVAVLMLVGGVVLFDAVRLGIGWGTDGPQSGFFPFWLGTTLLLACAVVLGQIAGRKPRGVPFVTREQLGPVLKVLWPATALVVLTQVLGIYVASALYIGFYMRWVGAHSWRSIVVLSIGIPLVTFLVFEHWFLVPLPKGPLEQWLGY